MGPVAVCPRLPQETPAPRAPWPAGRGRSAAAHRRGPGSVPDSVPGPQPPPGPARRTWALLRPVRSSRPERPLRRRRATKLPWGRARAVTHSGGGVGRAEGSPARRARAPGAGFARVSRRGRGRDRRRRSGGTRAERRPAEFSPPGAASAIHPLPSPPRGLTGRWGAALGLTRLAVRWGEPRVGRGLRAPVAAGAAAALGRGCGGGRAGGGGVGGCDRGAAAQVGPGRRAAGAGGARAVAGWREGTAGGVRGLSPPGPSRCHRPGRGSPGPAPGSAARRPHRPAGPCPAGHCSRPGGVWSCLARAVIPALPIRFPGRVFPPLLIQPVLGKHTLLLSPSPHSR